MQCKDINEEPILMHLLKIYPNSATLFDVCIDKDSLLPFFDGIPPKLIFKKLEMMVRKKVVSGCWCGCRGDFLITHKGIGKIKHKLN
jgi:hypothetical protein